MDRMVRNSAWPNDETVFFEGERVVRRVFTDNNRNTRRRGLLEHYDFSTYVIISVENRIAVIIRESDNEIIEGVPCRDLRKVSND